MFNIKQLVNRITDNTPRNDRDGGGETSAAFVDNEEQHSAEGFLCPPCMKAFPSAEALEEHYNKTHVDVGASETDGAMSNGEVQVLREEIQTLQLVLADEKLNCEELKKEILKMQADLNARDIDATSLRSQEKEFEDAKSLLTSEVTLLRQQLADSLQQVSILRKQNEASSKGAELTSSENETLKKEITSLHAQLVHRNSVDDAEVLRQELVSVQKLMNQMSLEKEKEVEALNNKLNSLLQPNTTTDKLQDQLNEALNEVQVLKDNRNAADQEHNELIKNYTEEISQKSAKISELEQACELNHEKIGKLDEERTHLRADYSELCSKIEAGEGAKAAVEGLQKENTTLKSDLDNLRLQNTELNKKHHDLSLKLERSAKDNKSLQGSLDSKSEEVKTLRNQMNLALSEKEKELEGLRQANQKFSSRVQMNDTKIVALTRQIKEQDEGIAKLTSVKNELSEKMKLNEKTIAEKNVEIEDLNGRLKMLEVSAKDLEKTLETCRNEAKTAQSTADELQTKLSALKIELEQTKENYGNELKSMHVKLKENKEKLHDASEQFSSYKQSMEDQEANFKSRIAVLESELDAQNSEVAQLKISINELSARSSESEQKLQLLQSKMDELIQQKIQLEQTCESNEEEKSQLLEKLISNEAETKSLNVTIQELTRKRDDAMAALQELGRENQSLQIEIAKIQGRKWADDSNATSCSSCTKEFTLTFRKHHCRHCGQIFCSDCSAKSASVPSSKKPVRVCDACYVKLTTQ